VADYADCGEDTAMDLERHYSYRIEQGKTGRMMALITKLP
jgi:copper oxidase (laccase) domain-containing protein